jgi:hypothetical protein
MKKLKIDNTPFDCQEKHLLIRSPKKDSKTIPDPKKHQIISFIKSGIRIFGYCLIPFYINIAVLILVFSELIGIYEELV